MVCAERYSEEDKLFLIVAISNIAKFWREEYVRGHRGVACSELSPNIHHHLGYEMLPGVLSAMIVARFSRISPVQFRKSQYRVDVVKLSFKKKITWTNKLLHDCPLEFVHWSCYQFSNVCKTHCPLSLFWYRRLTLTLLSLFLQIHQDIRSPDFQEYYVHIAELDNTCWSFVLRQTDIL